MTAALKDRESAALEAEMRRIGDAAREASRALAIATPESKTGAIQAAAKAIRTRAAEIIAANREDVADAKRAGLAAPLVDRLMLDDKRVEAIAKALDEIAALPDPVGTELARWQRPNGLDIARVRVPLGVIGIIYESRPNVTADAGALCLRAGNACILRGGSESFHSSRAIADCLAEGLRAASLPEAAIQLVPTRDRAAVGLMLTMPERIDVIIPRGGKGLVDRVMRESRVPVLAHLEGNCHVYVDGAADLAMARQVTLNAKMRRTSVCGAAETLLVDARVARTHLAPLVKDLLDAGCAVRGDQAAQAVDPRVAAASDQDWDTEFLDAIIAVKVVDGVQGAIDHVNRHGSHHTDSIVTQDAAVAEKFMREVDSGIVLHNASTQFADGGEFGMGAEIGISTNRLHARGPVGAEQLTSFKYVVRGSGQTRP